jgi:drug/metabolite transporter (DMT)-like permease
MDEIPIFLFLPLVLGLMYSVAAMAFKRALAQGVDIRRIIFFSNLATAILLLPLLSLASKPNPGAAFYQPLLAGLAFFSGIVLNIVALHRGDVSVATPLLGTKVLFVALFTLVVLGKPVLPSLWISAVLVAMALVILRGPSNRVHHRFWATLFFAVGSSSAFALCDIFFQLWTRIWGVGLFVPIVFGTVCMLSIALLRWFPVSTGLVTGSTWKWLIAGCVLNGLQTLGMVICVGMFRHPNAATAVNIVYNSRGIWSVMLVWILGGWFGNIEREQGARVMAARFTGAVLLLSAIVITLLQH